MVTLWNFIGVLGGHFGYFFIFVLLGEGEGENLQRFFGLSSPLLVVNEFLRSCLNPSDLSGMGDSRESFAIETPIFIVREADSPESLEFPIRANIM